MKNKLIFNKITTDDLPHIQAIERRCYPNPWSRNIMQDCIHAGYQCIKGQYESDGPIISYAFMMFGFEESNLLNITVHPEHQGQGLAQQMLQHLFLLNRINHAKEMWLEVRASNVPAIKLYERFQFRPISRRKNYYQYQNARGERIKEDAIVMRKNLQNR